MDTNTNPSETQVLIDRTQKGERSAFEELFNRHRMRLHKAITIRMDRRLVSRMDASDILQDTYMEAFRRFPEYLKQQKIPFYIWLFWIAREHLITMHRRHFRTQKRSVRYEVPLKPIDNSAKLLSRLIGRLPSPSQELAKKELANQLRAALEQLDTEERDLILWRHFEQLSARDTAQLLKITEAAAHKRYIRAIERLRKILQDFSV